MPTVITVENLGKKYLLSHQAERESYVALRDVLTDGVRNLGHRLLGRKGAVGTRREEFWALKDLSFKVKQGDRIGILGRNGAGKSTLLKILSRITEPTTGSVRIRGRVASLLEVGTGFHPELTGRENIFLNGTILGMSRVEICRKFDEIVAFAEVDKFLDTPVKRYSSGMYVRLAFAVAAHLEPEILIVDEVLAVGDAQFQKKCLGKMAEVSVKEGRTVLFVSHNLRAISELCNRGVWIDAGQSRGDGVACDVVRNYLEHSNTGSECGTFETGDRCGHGGATIEHGWIEDDAGREKNIFSPGEALKFGALIKATEFHSFSFNAKVTDSFGTIVLHLASRDYGVDIRIEDDFGRIAISVDNVLNHGKYFVSYALMDPLGLVLDKVVHCLAFEVSGAEMNLLCEANVRVAAKWKVMEG